MKLLELTEEMEFKIEEVDVLTGSILGRPNTGTFRLQDLVGIDTGENVSKFVRSSVKGDEFIDSLAGEVAEIDPLAQDSPIIGANVSDQLAEVLPTSSN